MELSVLCLLAFCPNSQVDHPASYLKVGMKVFPSSVDSGIVLRRQKIIPQCKLPSGLNVMKHSWRSRSKWLICFPCRYWLARFSCLICSFTPAPSMLYTQFHSSCPLDSLSFFLPHCLLSWILFSLHLESIIKPNTCYRMCQVLQLLHPSVLLKWYLKWSGDNI